MASDLGDDGIKAFLSWHVIPLLNYLLQLSYAKHRVCFISIVTYLSDTDWLFFARHIICSIW